MVKKLLWSSLIYLVISVQAQTISWTDQTTQVSLPAGVKLFRGERASPLLKCWYLDIDLNNSRIAVRPYISQVKMGVVPFTQSVGAFAAINGGFFDINSSTSYSAVVYPGEVKAQNIAAVTRDGTPYYVTRGFFGITYQRDPGVDWIFHFGNEVSQLYTFPQPSSNAVGSPAPRPDSSNGDMYANLMAGIGGGPVLIKDSTINITYTEEVFWGSGVGLDNQDPRTAVGYTQNRHVIFFVADGRDITWSNGVSLPEIAGILLSLGCVEAMNLDGGGSSQMAIGDLLINRPEGGTYMRPIPTILALVDADSIPLPPKIRFEKIIDTGDPECTLQGSGWFASANAGYWGNTPAMLNQIGTGLDYAEFIPDLPDSGRYEVYAWWVASSNRCADSPFIITRANGTDTVRVNQQDNGSRWYPLGTYIFRGDSSDRIILSDAAPQGTYIVADAIRIISYDTTVISGIVPHESEPLQGFALEQNYPNPFNPATTIKFYLKNSSRINLKIFNIMGQEIETLLRDRPYSGGWHEIQFRSENLSSGIYFYRLETGTGSAQKKMIVLK